MKIVMKDGTQIECTAQEAVELKNIGLFNDIPLNSTSTTTYKSGSYSKTYKPIRDKKFRLFTEREDEIIRDVWEDRKNPKRFCKKEYNRLVRLLPSRNRKAINARVYRLRRLGYLQA